MKRISKETCPFCERSVVDPGTPYCGDCGTPTRFASHEDRVKWEVKQWRQAPGDETTATAQAVMERPERKRWFKRVGSWAQSSSSSAEPTGPRPVRMEPSPTIPPELMKVPVVPPAEQVTPPVEPAARATEQPPSPPRPSQLRHASRAMMKARPQPMPVQAAPKKVAPKPARAVKALNVKALNVKASKKAPVAKPSKPKTPTNQEMLKRTLAMVTRVEKRLAKLEAHLSESVMTVGSQGKSAKAPEGVRKPAKGKVVRRLDQTIEI